MHRSRHWGFGPRVPRCRRRRAPSCSVGVVVAVVAVAAAAAAAAVVAVAGVVVVVVVVVYHPPRTKRAGFPSRLTSHSLQSSGLTNLLT